MAAVNINAPINAEGTTELYKAVLNENLQKVEQLIAEGADINKARTDIGVTPLYIAAEKNYLPIVNALLAAGVDINKERTDIGATPLFTASQFGHFEIVQALLAAGADINKARTDNGVTPLYIASSEGYLEIVQGLIAAGADINKETTDDGDTPLFISSQKGYLQIVQALLAAGVDINKGRTDNGATPLYIACEKNYLQIVEALLEAGANTTISSFNGKSVLQHAKDNQFSLEMNQLIISVNFQLNQSNINKPNSNILNVGMGMNSPFNNVYGDQDNIVFKIRNSFFAYPREQIQIELNNKSGIRYVCCKEFQGAPYINDINIQQPYYLLKGTGIYMIPLIQIIKAIINNNNRFYELIDTGIEHPFTTSYTSVQKTPGFNQSGNPVDIVGAHHCQAGSTRKVYILKKLNIKAAAPQGGKRRKTKKAKKLRKNKNKSRKH